MKNETFVKATLFLAFAFAGNQPMVAQYNFYHRVDVGSGNIYSFVGSNLVTGYSNYFTHDILFDNSFSYTLFNGRYQGMDIKTKTMDPMGIMAKDIFSDCFAGIKLGYQSDLMGGVNWGIYASAHYRINQFDARFPFADDYQKESVQYVKPGTGVLLTLGSVESKTKVQFEAALRYDIPIAYKGVFGNKNSVLEKGLSSHFGVKVAGYTWFSAGLYADMNFYDLYKDMGSNSQFKIYSVGLTFTITPKRGEDLYD